MKTYLLNILNRYKRFSETLDVKTILCNKSWLVFNDGGEKEVYIFQEDGSLIISFAGKVTQAKWQYLPVNKSLIISANEDAYMLHPAFVDEKVFALQQDGTDMFAFMIDERQSIDFFPKTLTELTAYFEEKERKKLQEQQMARQKALEQERIVREKALEQERIARKRTDEWEKKKQMTLEAEMNWEKEKNAILENDLEYIKITRLYKKGRWFERLIYIIGFVVGVIFVLITMLLDDNWLMDNGLFLCLILGVVVVVVMWGLGALVLGRTPWGKANPDDYIQNKKKKYVEEYLINKMYADCFSDDSH